MAHLGRSSFPRVSQTTGPFHQNQDLATEKLLPCLEFKWKISHSLQREPKTSLKRPTLKRVSYFIPHRDRMVSRNH